ncbi:mutS protein homolog 5-like [Cotesia glomerata]|uniref:mutS protein homolog 5-like n=1 Tax=Cotesia glomerata TaxID=32391 RepID=UPI001D02E239|nr:mutS protein homolog 5-like [Cotesia glomerata]
MSQEQSSFQDGREFKFDKLLDTSSEEEEEQEEEQEKENIESDTIPVNTSEHSEIKSQKISEENDHIILSLVWKKNGFGAAYYNLSTFQLFVMEDVMEDDFSYQVTKSLYRQCNPMCVIILSGAPESFTTSVKKLVAGDLTAQNEESFPSTSTGINRVCQPSLKILSKNENAFDNCYHRVRCLKLDCEPEDASNADRVIFLNSLLNFKSLAMIHALGLLLKYLDESWNKLSLTPSGQARYVNINYVMLQDLVMIEDDTYNSLNIMQSRFNSSFQFGKNQNQRTDLFTFLNRCQSRPGSHHLWKIMKHPTRNIKILQERTQAIEFFLNVDNQHVVHNLKSCLSHVHRLTPTVLVKYSTAQANPSDWGRFATTLVNLLTIGQLCQQYRDSVSIFAKIADSITPGIHNCHYFIEYIIDFEMSKQQRKFIVKRNVDPELDQLNDLRQTLPSRLTDKAAEELENLPPYVEKCIMVYIPDIQHCLAITEWNGPPPDDEMIPGLEFKFSLNNIRYYKSNGARELDETIGDVLLKITRRQSQIMLRLVNYVKTYIGPVLNAVEYCAELDVLLSFASVASSHNYVKPEIVKSHVLSIKKGRHPLSELNKDFIANDTQSGGGSSLVKIFTGPNACGKTVYLKQVALIVYMAHIGCYVPAESAKIGVVTHILTQMPTMESIAQNASAFLIDLRQMNNILYSSTPNSLILMDELGKGTSEIDSLALLTSILKNFIQRGNYCPHILCATHVHRVIELLPKTPILEAMTFDYQLDENNTVVFLYELISGNVTCSFAHATAISAGLAENIVLDAIKTFKSIKQNKLPPCCPEEDRSNVVKHIAELANEQKFKIDMQEFKQWILQAIKRR